MFYACCGVSGAGAWFCVNLWSSGLEVELWSSHQVCVAVLALWQPVALATPFWPMLLWLSPELFLRCIKYLRIKPPFNAQCNTAVSKILCNFAKVTATRFVQNHTAYGVLFNTMLSMRRTAPKKAATASSTGCLPSSPTGTSSSASTTWNQT